KHNALAFTTSAEIGLENTSEDWEIQSANVAAVVVFASPTDLSTFYPMPVAYRLGFLYLHYGLSVYIHN
ncbi:MAG: hypothetical protein ACJAU4_001520, partial [Glaciecola sp.]